MYRDISGYGDMYRNNNGEFYVAHYTLWDGMNDWIEPISIDEAKELIGDRDSFLYQLYFGEKYDL